MTKEEFLTDLETALEVPGGTINESSELAAIRSQDSLAVITLIAEIDRAYSVVLSREQITECMTMNDLFALIKAHQPSGN